MEYTRNVKWRNRVLYDSLTHADAQIFEIIVQMQRKQPEPDYFAICTCLVHLNDYTSAAKDLSDLTQKGGDVTTPQTTALLTCPGLSQSITNCLRSRILRNPRIPSKRPSKSPRIRLSRNQTVIRGTTPPRHRVQTPHTKHDCQSPQNPLWRINDWNEPRFPLPHQQNRHGHPQPNPRRS